MSGKYIDIKYKTHSLPSLHSIQNMTETSFSPQEKKNVSSFIFTFLMFLFQLWQKAILKKFKENVIVIIMLYFYSSCCSAWTITNVLCCVMQSICILTEALSGTVMDV